MELKVTLISAEYPLPLNHGGKIDTFRKIQNFAEQGILIQSICWAHQPPTPQELELLNKYCHETIVLPYPQTVTQNIHRVASLFHRPLHMSSRLPDKKTYQKIGAFEPNLYFLDGIYGYQFLKELVRRQPRPWIYRSHNVEFRYERSLLNLSRGYQRFQKQLQLRNLEKLETEAVATANRVYDISYEDSLFWQQRGFPNVLHVPPLTWEAENLPNHPTEPIADCAFVGNLRTPNNVTGVKWFLQEVMPLVKLQRPNFSAIIAGSQPVPAIVELCDRDKAVTLIANAPSSSDVWRSARCAINPIQVGSGVQLKSVEMLSLGLPIVSHPQGVYGLPPRAKSLFRVASTAAEFARSILSAIDNPLSEAALLERKIAYNELFGKSMAQWWANDLREFGDRHPTGSHRSASATAEFQQRQ